MELQRKIRAIVNNVSSQSGNVPTQQRPHNSQSIAALIVMIAVLTIIILFCCLAAPGIRSLCKRYIFKTCVIDDPDLDNVYTRKGGYDTQAEVNEIREYKKKMDQEARAQRTKQ